MQHNSIREWKTINGTEYFFKSAMECKYALYLEWLRKTGNIHSWQYEPREFWFEPIRRGCVSYKPDFCILEKSNPQNYYWVEVKGYMDAKSKTKIARFKKYFPNEKLEIVDSSWFTRNSKKLKGLVPGWT